MRALTLVIGAFVAVLALMTVPILATGSWSAFVSQVFADKGDYLRVGSSYFTIVHNQLDVLVSAVTDGERALTILHAVAVLLPIVIVVIVAWAIARARGHATARRTLRDLRGRRAAEHVPASGVEPPRRRRAARVLGDPRRGRVDARPPPLPSCATARIRPDECARVRGADRGRGALGRRLLRSARRGRGSHTSTASRFPNGSRPAPPTSAASCGITPTDRCSSCARTPASGTSPPARRTRFRSTSRRSPTSAPTASAG